MAVRKQLAERRAQAMTAAHDPMIELARLVEPARKLPQDRRGASRRSRCSRPTPSWPRRGSPWKGPTSIPTPPSRSAWRSAWSRATQGGERIPPWTTLGGAYRHAEDHGGQPPYALPKRWLDRKDRLDLRTPLNFLSTADIIGGNSGSPVVNRAGELVGVIFDGNLPSLVWDFVYDDSEGRAIAVDARAIQESLRKVYARRGPGRPVGTVKQRGTTRLRPCPKAEGGRKSPQKPRHCVPGGELSSAGHDCRPRLFPL